MEVGELGILNVGAGDVKLSFDPANPAERMRAARIVKDMLRRGYALLIKVDEGGREVWRRALDFEEASCEYIIADFDPTMADRTDHVEVSVDTAIKGPEVGQDQAPAHEAGQAAGAHVRRGRGRRGIPAERTTGVAVSRTAGG